MAGYTAVREYLSWTAEGHSRRIEYSVSVLRQIELTVIDGLNRLRHGGVEVGGVLFGSRSGEHVTVDAFRPLACEYAFGPKFVLSANDHAGMRKLLESARTDWGLQGLVPVGWYHSHTRSALHLSAQDLEIFNRHFPEPWQVALVFRPEKACPTKAGFFFREADGSIHAESSYCEFSVPTACPEPRRPVAADVATRVIPARMPDPPSAAAGSAGRTITYAALTALALVGAYMAASEYQWRSPAPRSRLPVPLSLSFEPRGGKLRITWDRKADSIRDATSASLEIIDGARTTPLQLDGNELRTGAVMYTRTSANVFARLKVGAAEASATFVGSPLPAAPEPEVDIRTTELREQADLPERRDAPPEREIPAQERKTIAYRPPPAAKPKPVAIPLLASPPVERFASSPTASANLLAKLSAAPVIPPPPPTRAPRAAEAVHARPSSGTLIWTGRVARNGTLTIDGSRSSTGSLSGEAPGFPVRIRVHPAELTPNGLTVYTEDTGRVEAPGPRNGWNRTSYVHDLKRARSVATVEAPAANNNWRRLVLRGEGSALSLVVVEWRAIVPKQ